MRLFRDISVYFWIVSLLDKIKQAEMDRSGYLAQSVRSETGIGAEKASDH